jgi:hypothetical protein
MSSDEWYMGDPVINPHEVGVFSELGDDFTHADPLSLSCYRGDRHEALLRSGVDSVGNLIQSLVEVPERESLSEMSVSFVLLFVATRRAFLSAAVSSGGALADTSSSEMSSRYRSGRVSEAPALPAAIKT